MAMAHYEGVAGIARRVTKSYEGVAAVARRVMKRYVGVDGAARQYFSSTVMLSVTTDIFPASNASDAPSCSCTADGSGLTVSMASARWSSINFDTDRNTFWVYVEGIKTGDVVSFIGTDHYSPTDDDSPHAAQAIDITYGSNVVKSWSDNGTGKEYSFTADADSSLMIILSDGDVNRCRDTITFTITNFTINGIAVEFTV